MYFSSDQSLLPSAVRVVGATLQFLSVSSEVNGLYQCETSNPYGRRHGYLYVSDVPSGEGGGGAFKCVGVFCIFFLLCVFESVVDDA